jgi:hypothetical protein
MRIETGKILPELASGRKSGTGQPPAVRHAALPEGLTEGQGAKGPSTMLRMVPLPETSSGRII